jgi:CheY-like chemotaxis protein
MRILLAEDSAVYRHLISGHLKEWGFDLVIAKNGAEAWNLLQQPEPPSLVLLDWVLPEIDGIELCRKNTASRSSRWLYLLVLITDKDGKNDLLDGSRKGLSPTCSGLERWKRYARTSSDSGC